RAGAGLALYRAGEGWALFWTRAFPRARDCAVAAHDGQWVAIPTAGGSATRLGAAPRWLELAEPAAGLGSESEAPQEGPQVSQRGSPGPGSVQPVTRSVTRVDHRGPYNPIEGLSGGPRLRLLAVARRLHAGYTLPPPAFSCALRHGVLGDDRG